MRHRLSAVAAVLADSVLRGVLGRQRALISPTYWTYGQSQLRVANQHVDGPALINIPVNTGGKIPDAHVPRQHSAPRKVVVLSVRIVIVGC